MLLVFWAAVRFVWLVVGMILAYLAFAAAYAAWQATSDLGLGSAAFNTVMPVALFAFVFAAPWVLADQWLAQQEHNAHAQQTYRRLSKNPGARLQRPLVFYLRSFDWDEKFANEKMKRRLFGPI
jgi:hypothetical protein